MSKQWKPQYRATETLQAIQRMLIDRNFDKIVFQRWEEKEFAVTVFPVDTNFSRFGNAATIPDAFYSVVEGLRETHERVFQQKVIDGFNAAVKSGWTPPVPEESRCKKCHKPHLPSFHLCAECKKLADEAPSSEEKKP